MDRESTPRSLHRESTYSVPIMAMHLDKSAGGSEGAVQNATSPPPAVKAKAAPAAAKGKPKPSPQKPKTWPKVPSKATAVPSAAAKAAPNSVDVSTLPIPPPPPLPFPTPPPSKAAQKAATAKATGAAVPKAEAKAIAVPKAAPVDPAKPAEEVLDSTTWFVPYFVERAEILEKSSRCCVQKSWRDWQSQLQNLRNFGAMDGYHIPKSVVKGKSIVSSTTLMRIAVEESDVETLTGKAPMSKLVRALRKFIAHHWFKLACGVPALYFIPKFVKMLGATIIQQIIYKYTRHYIYANLPSKVLVKSTLMGEIASYIPRPAIVTRERSVVFLKALAALALLTVGRLLNRFFRMGQTYLIVRISSQAFEQTYREVGNAEQEKATTTGIASLPALTRVANECLDSAKAMHPVLKVQYTAIAKVLVAAVALNTAQLHEHKSSDVIKVEHFVKKVLDNVKADTEVTAKAIKDAKDAEDKKKAAQGAAAAEVETKELAPGVFKLLDLRTSDVHVHKPSTLRDSVVIRERTKEQIFEEKQRGVKIKTDGDEKLIDYAGVVFGPELLRVISSLEPNIQNEIGGAHRHLRKLEHPTKKNTLLPMPTVATEIRMDKATKIMADHFARTAKLDMAGIAYWDAPKKWSAQMREEQPELAEQRTQYDGEIAAWIQRMMSGFVKGGEFMVDESKMPRLIGNQGPTANMEDAMSYAPLEHMMLKWYEHLITKGKTMDEIDAYVEKKLRKMRARGLKPCSDDYQAMDSSWTLNDRQRLHQLACAVLRPLEEFLQAKLRAMDGVLDADEHKAQLKWHLKYITLLMDPVDSPLFSGERPTSLKNRWLVLIGKFAEDLRCLGDIEGEAHIVAVLDGELEDSTGDGDDDAQGIPQDRYATEADRIEAYAKMHKLLNPASHFYEQTDVEVLSRFHIWREAEDDYLHVAKLQRQMGRLTAYKIARTNMSPDIKTTALTQKELIGICTDIWQRSFALQSTMVVRQFGRMLFDFAYVMVIDNNATTLYSDDHKRLGCEDGDKSLTTCRDEIIEGIANAKCSGRVMVKVAHFKTFLDMKEEDIVAEALEWERADEIWSTAELDWSHQCYPEMFLDNFPISSRVADALGVQESCMTNIRARELAAKNDESSGVDGPTSPPEPRDDSTPGELASVTTQAGPGGSEFSTADPVSESRASSSGEGNTFAPMAEARDETGGFSGASGVESPTGNLVEVKTPGKSKLDTAGVEAVRESAVVESSKKALVLDEVVASGDALPILSGVKTSTLDQKVRQWELLLGAPRNADARSLLLRRLLEENGQVAVSKDAVLVAPGLSRLDGQAIATETSREPEHQANSGRAGSLLARTKQKGQRKDNRTVVSNKSLAGTVGVPLEPLSSLEAAIDAPAGVKQRKGVTAKLTSLGSAINSAGSESHGVEQTDTPGGATSSASASTTTSPEGVVAKAAATPPWKTKKVLRTSWVIKENTPEWGGSGWHGNWENHGSQTWSSR